MNIFLQQTKPDYEAFRGRIESGQRFTIGGSELANRKISHRQKLPDFCVVLEASDVGCTLTNVASRFVDVTVNGIPAHTATLKTGDVIRIGSAEFIVTWKQPSVTQTQPVAPPAKMTFIDRPFPSGLRQYHPGSTSWTLSELVEQMSKKLTPVLFVNHKVARIRTSADTISLPDLFADAPDEIRNQHSLRAITDRPMNELVALSNSLQGRDASFWAFTTDSPSSAVKESKIYHAWFAMPSSLGLHLEKGSKVLAEGLTKHFAAFCLQPASGADWLIYRRPETTWQDLGLQQAPTT